MVVGVDEISGIAGIISLSLTLLHGCVKGFELLCRARKCETQMSSLRLMLEFEEQSLLTWAQSVGLLMSPPKLRIAVQHSKLVQDTLQHLHDLLSDMKKLRSYGFEAEQTSEMILDMSNDTALARLHLNRQPDVQESIQATTAIFHSRIGPWHRLKWVAVDERRFRALLGDISELNHQLRQLLDDDRTQLLERRHNNLLRSAVMSTTSQYDLDILSSYVHTAPSSKSIAATARFKGWSLRLGLFDRFRARRSTSTGHPIDEVSDVHTAPSLRPRSKTDGGGVIDVDKMKLLRRHLRLPSSPHPHGCRQLAYYDYRPVMVEWRPVTPEDWKLLNARVSSLASLLNSVDDPSFHTMTCRGYLRYEHAGVYGYVFDVPHSQVGELHEASGSSVIGLPNLPQVQTLSELLNASSTRPSLNVRVLCAINILETLLQLHTAGWLHKELRPENVLFLRYKVDMSLQTDDFSRNMYVGGYVYARADNSQEFTEPAVPGVTSELYRHSASVGPIRLPYRKSFDIFSAGCILLELGMWSDLPAILRRMGSAGCEIKQNRFVKERLGRQTSGSEKQDEPVPVSTHISQIDRSHLLQLKCESLEQIETRVEQSTTIIELLEADAGKTYANVVLECLAAATMMMRCQVGDETNEHDVVLELEQRSLRRLKQLVEVL